MSSITAIIADDEDALRQQLIRQISRLWPELLIVGEAGSGIEALQLIRDEEPDIAFLDIRMPGLNGLEVAQKAKGLCHSVFVTAYDQYAVQAFEEAAVDYILKPVEEERLQVCIERLQSHLHKDNVMDLQKVSDGLRQQNKELFRQPLRWIRAGQNDDIRIIPVQDVIYFVAEDKYTIVITAEGEWLIRKTIKELEAELDHDQFWRIHRKYIINLNFVEKVRRGVDSRYHVHLAIKDKALPVSRTYSHQFKSM